MEKFEFEEKNNVNWTKPISDNFIQLVASLNEFSILNECVNPVFERNLTEIATTSVHIQRIKRKLNCFVLSTIKIHSKITLTTWPPHKRRKMQSPSKARPQLFLNIWVSIWVFNWRDFAIIKLMRSSSFDSHFSYCRLWHQFDFIPTWNLSSWVFHELAKLWIDDFDVDWRQNQRISERCFTAKSRSVSISWHVFEWLTQPIGSICITEWLAQNELEKVSLVITNVHSKEVLECWEFKVQCEPLSDEENADPNNPKSAKELKRIQQEIGSVMRQISATVSYLPLLDCICSFDVLIHTLKDCQVPEKWNETAPVQIVNQQSVKLRSFSTGLHQVDTVVNYKLTS